MLASRNVTATLTDEAGRTCAGLFEGRPDAGTHTIPIRTDGLSCGLYHCVIRADGITTSAPLIITR
jgi:hypothetical protein